MSIKHEVRCKKHPNFCPGDEMGQENRDCFVCNGLYYGSLPIGHYDGEFEVGDRCIDESTIKIYTHDLENFGHVRYSLGWDYHFDDGPSWHVDWENLIIYLDRKISKSRLKEFRDKYKCKIFSIKQEEPRLEKINYSNNNETGVELVFIFGKSNQKESLKIKKGMSVKEVVSEMLDFISKTRNMPSNSITETKKI